MMKIFPAIDLRKEKCVRLLKGDFARQTTYSDDALAIAKKFESEGAKFLHVVNLDAAKGEDPSANLKAIKSISENTNLKIDVGGGIRQDKDIETLLKIGIDKVIIGSLSVRNPSKTLELIKKYGKEKIILSLDVNIIDKIPYVAINGWQKNSDKTLWQVIEYYGNNIKYVLCTDISRDGALQGTNLDLYKQIARRYPYLNLIASGGVTKIEELKELNNMKLYGIIIGKALYENKLNLKEILEIIKC